MMAFYFVALILSAFFIIPSKNVDAAEALPICTDGYIEYGGLNSTFDITLNCQNIAGFNNIQDIASASVENKMGVFVHPSGIQVNPFILEIIGSQLHLVFYTTDETLDRDILINSEVLINSEGLFNNEILISTADILDRAAPVAVDDVYEISNSELTVDVADSVLLNDYDGEGLVSYVEIEVQPEHGAVTLNGDGSFIYSRDETYIDGDFFSYLVYDEAGNSDSGLVVINSSVIQISGDIYRTGSLINNDHAKVGDTIKAIFASNTPIIVDDIRIGDHSGLVPQIIDDYNFYATYVLRESDLEGSLNYTLTAHSAVGVIVTVTTEKIVIFDKTKPVIDLVSSEIITIEIHEAYSEDAVAADNIDGVVTVTANQTVNSDVAGEYIIVYDAVDKAGNHADAVIRTVNVVDQVALRFYEYYQYLISFGINNNLNTVTVDNVGSFVNLFFEKSINGVKISKIIFDEPLDLSGDAVVDFFYDLNNRMKTNSVGSIGIDFTDMADQSMVPFYDKNALIIFYNLDKIGFNSRSNDSEIYSKLITFDDNGNVTSKSESFDDNGSYANYTYSINVKYVSNYVIDNLAPVVTVNNLDDIKIGQPVTFRGTINDPNARIYLLIGEYYILVPSENVINGSWFYTFTPLFKRSGNYAYKVSAIDHVGNVGSDYGVLKVKNANSNQSAVVFVSNDYQAPSTDEVVITDTLGAQTSKDDEKITDSSSVNIIKDKDGIADTLFQIEWYYKVLIFASFIALIAYLVRIKLFKN